MLAFAVGLTVFGSGTSAERDVVLTTNEIRGLTGGLLVSHQPALGRVSFLEWLRDNASTLGQEYANELDRHVRVRG